MEGGLETDVVILVIGPTGAGKSTFIRHALGSLPSYSGPQPMVSDGFESCTKSLAAYIAPLPREFVTNNAKRLVIVDTPGFDDTCVSDSEILRRLSVWLASSYDAKMKVGGVLYVFPIYPNRMTRNDKANLRVFHQLCGRDALGTVRMVTTKWSLCPTLDTGEQRETQLREVFWKEMLEAGSHLSRLNEDQGSASVLLQEALLSSQQSQMALALQKEIVAKLRSVPRTSAGKELKRKLQELLREHKAASGDHETRQQKVRNIAAQLRDLKIPFPERIKAFFGLSRGQVS